MKYLLLLLLPLTLYGLYVVAVLAFGTINDYKPEPITKIESINKNNILPKDTSFSFLLWNIGYGGLGNKADFFFDGGKMVRSDKYRVNEYIEGIEKTIEKYSDIDFILLQEVDIKSKRSYKINQFERISNILPKHNATHALNFKVKYIPKPLTSTSPLGAVKSGLASYSKYSSTENIRYQFPGNFEWPNLHLCWIDAFFYKG